jgi:hypothetical protein
MAVDEGALARIVPVTGICSRFGVDCSDKGIGIIDAPLIEAIELRSPLQFEAVARAASGHTAPLPKSVMKSRRRMCPFRSNS